jgi:hypothetical protein
LELVAEAVVVLPKLPAGGTVDFGALSGAECLTLKVVVCCAMPLTLIPASAIAIANENRVIL